MKAIAVTFILLTALAIGGIVALQHWYTPTGGIPLEIAKALLNVLTLAITAQIVGLVIARYNESRQRTLERDRLRLLTIDVLNDAFVGVKAIRRSARAKSELRASSGTEELRFVTKRLYFRNLENLN